MIKIKALGLALVAMFALSAMVVATASAELAFELALWLNNGSDINSELLEDQEGSFEVEDALSGAAFLCSALFEGTVGPGSLDLITMIYDLVGNLVEELDEAGATKGLECEGVKICETPSEIWPLKLPWLTEVEQNLPDGTFWELTFSGGNGKPAYFILCLFLGGSVNSLCEPPEGAEYEILNVAGGVEGMGSVEPLGPCESGQEDELVLFDPGNLMLLITGVLSVSLNALGE